MGYNGSTTKRRLLMENMAFNIQVVDGYSQPNRHFNLEITQDYEKDKWHIVIFENYKHIDTVEVKTEKEVFNLIGNYYFTYYNHNTGKTFKGEN
tara:strand:+ start:3894 stop:4175 length:282 start_codon:yes stop_codon:yes gene_type:complete